MRELFSTAYLAAISTFYIKYEPYNTIQWDDLWKKYARVK